MKITAAPRRRPTSTTCKCSCSCVRLVGRAAPRKATHGPQAGCPLVAPRCSLTWGSRVFVRPCVSCAGALVGLVKGSCLVLRTLVAACSQAAEQAFRRSADPDKEEVAPRDRSRDPAPPEFRPPPQSRLVCFLLPITMLLTEFALLLAFGLSASPTVCRLPSFGLSAQNN